MLLQACIAETSTYTDPRAAPDQLHKSLATHHITKTCQRHPLHVWYKQRRHSAALALLATPCSACGMPLTHTTAVGAVYVVATQRSKVSVPAAPDTARGFRKTGLLTDAVPACWPPAASAAFPAALCPPERSPALGGVRSPQHSNSNTSILQAVGKGQGRGRKPCLSVHSHVVGCLCHAQEVCCHLYRSLLR